MTHNRPIKKLWEIILVIRNWKSCKQTKDNIWDKITRIETISDGTINEKKVWFFELSEDEKEKFSIEKWDILFSHINSVEHIGKVALAKKDYSDLFHGMNLLLIRADKKLIDPEFLYVVLNKFFEFWYRRNVCKKAINQASLNQPNIINISIPLPPLTTQKTIVAKLDETFAQIDEAIASTQANIDKTDELTKSVLDKVFEEGEWEKKKFWEVCNFVRWPFGWSLKKEIFKLSWYAVYEQQHAIWDQFDSIRYFIDEDKFNEMKRFELKSWDLIMSCSGTMWKIAIVPDNIKKWIINQALLKLTPSSKISKEFLKLRMQSKDFQDTLNEYTQGAAIKNVASVAILKNIQIPLPPLAKQQEIVSYLDHVFAQSSQLKEQYQKKLIELKELKASVLQGAFSGELV